MDLSLTEEQELLRRVTRDFVQREFPKETLIELEDAHRETTPELWARARDMGWLGMLIPVEYGGSGNSFTDAAVVFEELGRGPVTGPFFSSGVLAALTIAEAGTEEQKSEYLPKIAAGDYAVSLAVTEPDYGWTPESVGMSLTSKKWFVQPVRDQAICAGRTVCHAPSLCRAKWRRCIPRIHRCPGPWRRRSGIGRFHDLHVRGHPSTM